MKDRSYRHKRLLSALSHRDQPLSGAELATQCKVTRQVVVHDIALLRAQGIPIMATPRGYLLKQNNEIPIQKEYLISICHPPELTGEELNALVDNGVRIKDVIIEHPLYGEMKGILDLSSRRDVDNFLKKVKDAKVPLLSTLTGGHHFHTLEYGNDSHLKSAIQELKRLGIQVFEI